MNINRLKSLNTTTLLLCHATLALLVLTISTTYVSAQPQQISGLGPDDENATSPVGFPAFKLSPNGEYVVYFALPNRDSLLRIYSAPISGDSDPVELTSADTGGVNWAGISHQSGR